MNYTIKITQDAQSDIQDASDWYNNQQSQLGHRFFIQVAETIDYIANNPKLFPIKHQNARQANVSKFPFNVFYLFDEDKKLIVIIAVLHASRNPKIWMKRKP